MKNMIRNLKAIAILSLLPFWAWGQLTISIWTLSGAAVSSSDGARRLSGSIGQASVGGMASSTSRISPGFWAKVASRVTAVSTEAEQALPHSFSLFQNYPNPFNPSTRIAYELPNATNVSLKVFNALGQVAATLVNEKRDAGHYQVEWNASGIPSGIYFYRLQAGEYVETKKMILLR